jgi:hypothetical protein
MSPLVFIFNGVVNVKQSLYRRLGFQEVEASRISTHTAHGGGTVVSPTHLPHLPYAITPVTYSFESYSATRRIT